MENVTINYFAVLISAALFMIVGMLWYGPLFGKPWMAALGLSKEQIQKQGGAMKGIVLSLIAALLCSYVLAHIIDYAGATTAWTGMQTGFWVWLGFMAFQILSNGVYENRAMKVSALYISYQLLVLLVAGALLATWV